MPKELQKVSHDTYIQRKDRKLIPASDTDTGLPEHYECMSRFIGISEYHMLLSVSNAVEFKQEQEIIDDYTLSLIEEGVL